jgi:hypothetical protein
MKSDPLCNHVVEPTTQILCGRLGFNFQNVALKWGQTDIVWGLWPLRHGGATDGSRDEEDGEDSQGEAKRGGERDGRVGTFHVTLFCSQNTAHLMTAAMVHVTNLPPPRE